MKRKVALGGRPEREFSWSMSVEPGERCYRSMKRRKRASELPCNFAERKAPDFVLNDSFLNRAEQIPCFFGTAKKRTGQCCRNAALAKTRPADESLPFIYRSAADKRNLIRRQKQWQLRKRSESDSRATTTC